MLDPVELDNELRRCVDLILVSEVRFLTHVHALLTKIVGIVKEEDLSTRNYWTPRLRTLQDRLREMQKRLDVLRNQHISRMQIGRMSSKSLLSPRESRSATFEAKITGALESTTAASEESRDRAITTIAREMQCTVNETLGAGSAALTELDRQGAHSFACTLLSTLLLTRRSSVAPNRRSAN